MKEELYELALYSGSGGGLLASKLEGNRIVCYVERNKYCVEVLQARIRDGYLNDAPIWDDCNTFDGRPWAGLVDVISAGFPCQPFSSAGKGLSEADTRNGWPAAIRIIGEVRPHFAWLENVPGLISKPYIRRIFGDLAEIGYDAEWGTLSAASVGAPHKRERLWIIAYDNGGTRKLSAITGEFEKEVFPLRYGNTQPLAYSNSGGFERQNDIKRIHCSKVGTDFAASGEIFNSRNSRIGQRCTCAESKEIRNRNLQWWQTEPRLGRVADGVAHRMDRLEALGNGQVPEVARTAWHLLMDRIK